MHTLYEFQYSDKMDLKHKIYICIRKSICYTFSFVHMSLVLSPLIVASRGPNAVVIFLCVNAKYSQKRHCWFIGTIASVTQLRMYSFNKHRKTWWLLRTIASCMKDKNSENIQKCDLVPTLCFGESYWKSFSWIFIFKQTVVFSIKSYLFHLMISSVCKNWFFLIFWIHTMLLNLIITMDWMILID